MPEHRLTSRSTNLGQGSHPFLSWDDVLDEAARSALGDSVPVGITVYQAGGMTPGFYGSLGGGSWSYMGEDAETGWVSGLDLTINIGNANQYDMAAGSIRIKGLPDPVQVSALTAIDPLNLATEGFTINMIDAAGSLVQINRSATPAERKTHAVLQTVNHAGGSIVGIDSTRFLSAHMIEAAVDYSVEAGPLNTGNNYTAAADDLTVKKSAGTTDSVCLEGKASISAPNAQVNAEQIPVATLFEVIRDGAGGFTLTPKSSVPVGFWDDDTGALLATPKFVIYRFQFFNDLTGVIVGQSTYDTLDDAVAAVFTEDPTLPPEIVAVRNTFRTALVAKGDVTDLSSDVDMRFIQISPSASGGVVARSRML